MARKRVGLKIIAGCGNCWGSRPFQGILSYLMCGTNHLPCHLTLSVGETLSKHGNFWGQWPSCWLHSRRRWCLVRTLKERGAWNVLLLLVSYGKCNINPEWMSNPLSDQIRSERYPRKNENATLLFIKFLGIFAPLSNSQLPERFSNIRIFITQRSIGWWTTQPLPDHLGSSTNWRRRLPRRPSMTGWLRPTILKVPIRLRSVFFANLYQIRVETGNFRLNTWRLEL